MKTLIRNVATLVLGLLLTAFPAMATTWNVDLHAGNWGGGWISYNSTSTGVSAPSGATVAWYAYAYSGSGAWANVYATAPGVSINEIVGDNSQKSNQQNLTSAGYVTVDLDTSGGSGGGGTGCGVTVAW